MLSEEEEKAIEELKQLKKDFEIVDKIVKDRDKQETKTIDAILNLIEKQNKIIDNAINEVEKVRKYYDDGLQPEFIGILEILKDKKVIDW